MPRIPKRSERPADSMLEKLVAQIDARTSGAPTPDTVPTGFASLDRVLAGGLRRKDLVGGRLDASNGNSSDIKIIGRSWRP